MDGRTEGSTRLLWCGALIEGQSQQTFAANCNVPLPHPPFCQHKTWTVCGLSEEEDKEEPNNGQHIDRWLKYIQKGSGVELNL